MKGIILFIFCFIIFINAKGQEDVKTIPNVKEYNIQGNTIKGALNLAKYIADYSFFSIISQPYLLYITFPTENMMRIAFLTYNYTFLESNFIQKEYKEKGYCYYDDVLVLIADSIGVSTSLDLFWRHDEDTTIYYKPDYNIMSYEVYENSSLFLDIYLKSNGHNVTLLCDTQGFYYLSVEKKLYYYYLVRENDTWEIISTRTNCPIETLQNVEGVINPKLPEKDFLIILKFTFENKKLLNIERLQ